MISAFIFAMILSIGSPISSTDTVAIPRVRPVQTFKNIDLQRPVQIVARQDEPNNLYVLEQPGNIVILDQNTPDANAATLFMDLRENVRMKNNEEGLLSMAFSPNVKEDASFYLYYSASSPRRTILSRFKIVDGKGDPNSEEVLLEIPQPWGNHNGGMVLFGPDGMLYLSVGDGGAANDPRGHGQDRSTLLGTILRIDASGTSEATPYIIPADNPFIGEKDVRPEIWAYGLRNVWRMAFDRSNGELWAGDVGQNKWEEIDIITKGGNYGWNIREGKHAFSRVATEEDSELLDPIVEYPRSDGISVTGGYVYRGTQKPELDGVYLYADYRSGRIWGVRAKDQTLSEGPVQVATLRRSLISSFGEDANGELWLCSFDEEEFPGDGQIWRFTAAKPATKE